MSAPPAAHAVAEAAERIAGIVRVTPVTTCATLDERAGVRLFLKGEHLQRVGAFKFRGATNAVRALAPDEAARGVVTHSSGNHAQALALAARQRGVAAHIVMPVNAPAVKRRAVEGYGARIIDCAPTAAERERVAAEVVAATGGVLVPPFDHPHIIAGQGTAAAELLDAVPDLDAIVAPVGGGGLLAGTCLAVEASGRDVAIIGAEPAGADDAARSLAEGRRLPQDDPRTVCDGLRTGLGALTWPIIRDRVAAIETVDDEAVIAAMRLVWERAKQVIEPSAAVAVAVVLAGDYRSRGFERVGVILSGGNVDLDALPWI